MDLVSTLVSVAFGAILSTALQQLIEISCGGLSPLISQAEVNTTTLIEGQRLRRELLNATAAVRDAFPDRELLFLTAFQRKITEKFPISLSSEAADGLRKELERALRADVSISDK